MTRSDGRPADESGWGELRASARGWHGAQLAVLGFIGLCGVLKGAGDAANPGSVQLVAGLLVLLALVLQCLAVTVVAAIAWPLRQQPPGHGEEVERARRRLRTGVAITFVAVAVLALAATSAWWPRNQAEPAQVRVVTSSAVVCGQLRDGQPGLLALDVDGRSVLLALRDVSRIQPVNSCR